MSATPGKPRQSGIPGPGRATGIPTPGRSRASSSVIQQSAPQTDVEYMSRAFADAIKANDPAQHRVHYTNGASVASLSPQSISHSGRHSVTGRPSSVASSYSTSGSAYPKERPKTPVSARLPSRPPSRVSDVFGRSTTRAFEVGDNVRIESLGFEGTLRFYGELPKKQGIWAGVELSGGFAGKGKNNGAVDGIQYFSCPEKCGVFVAATKLSPPTVGAGAIPRPASVASSRGGRVTPAPSGRMTPSSSSSLVTSRVPAPSSSSSSNGRITPSANGRVTPSTSSGRITPGATPAARNRRALVKSTTSRPDIPIPVDQYTDGSRASKYMSMTAKQLSSRDALASSPSRRIIELESPTRSQSSPSHYSRSTASPTRLASGSPFSTPKPGLNGRTSGIGGGLPTPNKTRPSLTTPRGRIPSAIAMPPPASPMSSRSVSMGDHPSSDAQDDSEVFGKPLPERGQLLKSASATSSNRSDSAASIRSLAADDRVLIEQLQSRIDALEYDNERLRVAQQTLSETDTDTTELQAVQQERDTARTQIAALESALDVVKRNTEAQEIRVKSLEDENQQLALALEDEKRVGETLIAELQSKLDAELLLVRELEIKAEAQEKIIHDSEERTKTKAEKVVFLEAQLTALSAELQEEKNELGIQIDELRSAGQETIALYEERLNAADSQRYDLEQRITTLELRLQNAQRTSSPPPAIGGSSAAEIDNETLREQILHLQRKISTMEDAIEDAQAVAEREEAAIRERMKRLKEKEDTMRKELNDGRKEVERVVKSEESARGRVEEIEEALRESTVALENAQAEVEGLRAELAHLDGLVANSTGGDLSSRVADAAQRAANDKARYMQEIARLQESLEQYKDHQPTSVSTSSDVQEVRQQNIFLQEKLHDQEIKLTALAYSLDETSKELETMKKKYNRDVTLNGLPDALRPLPLSPSSKHDISAAREEIKGLKHIVQELQKENLEVQILEENLDKSLDQDEISNGPWAGGSEESPRKLREQKNRLELEQEQLRKRLLDAEMKSARTIHDLNKEISELEALVESKIYREDELEQELERMREKMSRHSKKLSRSSTGSTESRSTVGVREQVCEICERPGHDIFNCDVLNKEAPMTLRSVEDLYCEDCESHGHVAKDCPHSLDVF
ncbi:hypothetical protein H0H81_012019 [Sphagnurus paluster]|uniref:CAP-Gly domain-containing protein n=1 Tax=Sphagnurus paluster TaxID=117069 RepID=A0A9P7FTT2_9AGAR|nr:hypothetical protein H0H81_012019 [Sphagnurus paluster]